jgi:PAS domain S-box-containing protein
MKLRSHVLIIAAATLLAIIAIVSLAVVLLFQKQRDLELDRLVDTARALSLAADREFETGLASLRTLATSEHLRAGDLRIFYGESRSVLAVHEGADAIILVDPAGRQIINTRRPFGEALPQYGDPGFIEQVVTSRRPAVSNLFVGRIIQRPVISVGVPVILGGQVKYVLTLSLSPGSLQRLLAQGAIAADSLATIIDGNKIIVARTREVEKFFGKSAGPIAIAHITESPEGWRFVPRQRSRGVESSYAAHRRSEFSGWTVVIGVPTAKINAPFWQALQFIGGGIVVLLGVALGLAALFGRRIISSITALAAGANALGSRETVSMLPSAIFEIDQVRQAIETASEARNQIEAKLHYELQLVQKITENAAEAIITVNENGQVSFVNAEAERIFGFSAGELLGQSLHDKIHHSFPDGRPFPKADCPLIQSRLCGVTVKNHEDTFFRKDGSPVIVECSSAPVELNGKKICAVLIAHDIGARKRAQEELRAAHDELERRVEERTAALSRSNTLLRQKEDQLLLAQRAGHTGLWSRDLTQGTSSMSPEWLELMGFPIGDTLIRFAQFIDRVHPDDRERVKEMNRQQKIGDFDREFRIVHPVKGERWILSRGRRRISPENGHLQIMGAVIDITEHKQTEEALRRSEERLQHALTVGSMGLWERDLRTGKVQWDRRTFDIFGLDAADSVNLDLFFSRLHPDDLPAVKSAVDQTESTGAYVCEFRILRPDGKIIWLHANGGLRRDRAGTPTHLAGINFDITERKQAEDALRESEARLRAILDHNPAPVFIKDTAGRYVHVNKRFEELFGIDGENSIGKTDAELFAREQAEVFQTNDQKVLDLGHAIAFEEVTQYHDGQHTSIVNKFPLRDVQGNIYALCGIATDITERKAAEVALRELNEQLDQRVARRTQELADSQARLRSLVAELTRAEERERRRLAVELHDYLAQSLTATRMNLSRADKIAAGSNGSSKLKQILDDVQNDLTTSIDYTRTLIGELSPRVLYDLGLPAALGWIADQMGRHGLSVDVDGPRDEFSLAENDPIFLFQCVRELLWNVVKHGGTDHATIAYGRDGNRVSLAVIDNGKGFDPVTVHAASNGGGQFGLFSIRERVKLRGGHVEINSAPGAGTWVSIMLPVDHSEEVSVKTVKLDTQLSGFGGAIKIVIVDDHKVVRQGLRRVLEESGDFDIVGEAGDGAEAIAMARELKPHVVIMDVNLPTVSGIDATRDIVRERPSTIVIGLSFGSDAYVTHAMQTSGAVTCVAKEHAAEDITQAIMNAVEGRRWEMKMENGE